MPERSAIAVLTDISPGGHGAAKINWPSGWQPDHPMLLVWCSNRASAGINSSSAVVIREPSEIPVATTFPLSNWQKIAL
jgi:hypothetical protein